MEISESSLKRLLLGPELISQKDFSLAQKTAKEKNQPLLEVILDRGLVSDEDLGKLLADEFGFPFIRLSKHKINKEILEVVPEIVAKRQSIIVFDRTKEGLKVAMGNPQNLEIREFIERKTGEKVIPFFATDEDIEEAFKHYKKGIKEELDTLLGKTIMECKDKLELPEGLKLPVIKIVDLILNYGYENRASDIHIEPYQEKTILRYRIDGVLHDIVELPKFCQDFLTSRIKILAKLRTDIHEMPQDGHFTFSVPKEKIDVRVSVVPIEEGEKVVMRLLSERARRFDLEDLGIESRDLKILKENMRKSWGMILAVGPTGCGKTTTLYGMLKILNKREVNIMTIEDPIEYDIEGINQIQVNTKTNLTFANGLRSIIRQDPDIIMVGEIRDEETAKLAVNAALTGHLVLSTFHAIDSSTALPRLLDMSLEPFLVTSCLNVAIAQRLVRKICPKCIESYEASFSEISRLLGEQLALKLPKTKENKVRLFRGRGCSLCQNTGYLGRIGIFEILEMSEPIAKLVQERAPAFKIRETAAKLGMRTMIEDGLKKVENGITTIEEVLGAVK